MFAWILVIDIVLFVRWRQRFVSHNKIDKAIYHFPYWKVSLLSQYLFSQFVMHKYLPCYIWSHTFLTRIFFHNMWWGNYFEREKEKGRCVHILCLMNITFVWFLMWFTFYFYIQLFRIHTLIDQYFCFYTHIIFFDLQ